MYDIAENEFGVEYTLLKIKKLRIHRTDGKWLIEYRREPKWPLGLDRWWWFNDCTFTNYVDALDRVNHLKSFGYVSIAKFQTVKVFDLTEEPND